MSMDRSPDFKAFQTTDVALEQLDGRTAVIMTSAVDGEEPVEFEVGRALDGAFQPVRGADYALTPGVLRDLADALENGTPEGGLPVADAPKTTPGQATPSRENIQLDVGATTEEGEEVAITVMVHYPAGRGYTAVRALELVAEKTEEIYRQLVGIGDAETLRVLARINEEGQD